MYLCDGISAASDGHSGSRLSLSLEIKTSTLQKLSNSSLKRQALKPGTESQDELLIWKEAPPPAEMEDNIFIKTGAKKRPSL